jgi:hypothetical protein
MFDEFFADVKKPNAVIKPMKNHTDASIKKSPYTKLEDMDDSEDDMLENSPSGKIDFEELFKKSNKLHSRHGE